MAHNFRLNTASGGPVRKSLFDRQYQTLSFLSEVEFSQEAASQTEDAWVSVVIGKNGAGKSRLLAGIADVFEVLLQGGKRKRRDSHSISRLTYTADGNTCELTADSASRYRATLNGSECEIEDLPLPTKVIVLTTTPFDKFRVPRLTPIGSKNTGISNPSYAYLGLRDRSGRASPTASIYRALEVLFEASRSDMKRRLHVADVFSFLGYEPHVVVRYDFDYKASLVKLLATGAPMESLPLADSPGSLRRPLSLMLEREPGLLPQLHSVAREAIERANDGAGISIEANFQTVSVEDDFFKRVQILRRAGLLRMRAVELRRQRDGEPIDLRLASSGELGIVTGFLGLASVIEDGSLIFIDEPEISLHPEWQAKYIELLLNTFRRFRGCHFVLATHSPLILSDIGRENSNVVFLDPGRTDSEDADDFAGQSADHLLVTAFQAPGKNNLYLKQEIIRALRLAADGNTGSEEFKRTVTLLLEMLPNLENSSPTARLIREIVATTKMTGVPQ